MAMKSPPLPTAPKFFHKRTNAATADLSAFSGVHPECPTAAGHQRTKVYHVQKNPTLANVLDVRCKCDDCGASWKFTVNEGTDLATVPAFKPADVPTGL